MSHVITQACCNDASCVPVCPVGCIHPTPDEPGFATTEMLYIDPAKCIDCGACVLECPVSAIQRDTALTGPEERYLDINNAYFQRNPSEPGLIAPTLTTPRPNISGPLRVAIVGSGPAGSYAATELLEHSGVEVEMFDRLPTPWGLIRAGVAPDHPGTKAVTELFERTSAKGDFRFHLNVEIGTHLSHAELLAHHHAVIYAYGASSDRRLGIPGEDLAGSVAATEFVNWYNGHPEFADRVYDLSCTRAVIVGNGNVALDVARILVTDPELLARTDIADHALKALRNSRIEEVVVLGRRGPAQAAYTTPELLALGDLPGVDVMTYPPEVALDELSQAQLVLPDTPASARIKAEIAAEFAMRTTTPGNRRIILRYLSTPREIIGTNRVTQVRVAGNQLRHDDSGMIIAVGTDDEEIIDTGLVLRSVGYRGIAIPGVPFDAARAIVPNDGGRVVDPESGAPVPGVYTTGWIKRGPSGVIGTNKKCAQDTVTRLLADHSAGLLPEPTGTRSDLADLVATRSQSSYGVAGWQGIDRAERIRGDESGRPRRKLTTTSALLAAAAAPR